MAVVLVGPHLPGADIYRSPDWTGNNVRHPCLCWTILCSPRMSTHLPKVAHLAGRNCCLSHRCIHMVGHLCSRPCGIPFIVLDACSRDSLPCLHATGCLQLQSSFTGLHTPVQYAGDPATRNSLTCNVSRGFCCGKAPGRSIMRSRGHSSLTISKVAVLQTNTRLMRLPCLCMTG